MERGEASGKGAGKGWDKDEGCGQGHTGQNEWKHGICGSCSPGGMCKLVVKIK